MDDGGDGMWGQAGRRKKKRLGVTLSCQLALGANTHVMHGKTKRGKVRYKRFRHCLLSFLFFFFGRGRGVLYA